MLQYYDDVGLPVALPWKRPRLGRGPYQAARSATCLLLELVDPFGSLGLVEVGLEGLRLVGLFRERLQVRCLRARHRLVTRDPIVRVLDLVRVLIRVRL